MNYLVIYPGRFHPFHRGHRASYDYLAKKYGQNNVYIATTDVQAPVTSPFSFSDKVKMITTLGIPAGHVVKVKNPYQSREITDRIPTEEKAQTVLIFALSAKDAERFNFAPKKDGTPSYLQPMPENLKKLKPMTEHAYVEITPTVNFKVKGQDANSASQIRSYYIKGNDNDRDQIIADLYGEAYPELRDIFDDRLGVSAQVQNIVKEAKLLNTTKSIALLERILVKERQALNEYIVEISDETLQSYLGKADRQISNRLDRMSQARERLNRDYEIYHAENPDRPIERFTADTPEQAKKYYFDYIDNYNSDVDFDLRLRKSTGLFIPEGFDTKQQVIDYFVKQGKTAAQGAAAWERGYRGPKAKTAPVKSAQPQQRYWWHDKDDINESTDYLDEN